MKAERIQKAQSISKKLLSEYILQDLQELSVDFWIITITQVIISNDLSYMDIYVSSLKNMENLTKSLWEIAPNMQKILGKKIDFIKVPRIRFRYDESWIQSFQVYKTIKELPSK